jgi:beta-1,4-mannosyltransferase
VRRSQHRRAAPSHVGVRSSAHHALLTPRAAEPRSIDVLLSPGPERLTDNPCLALLFAEVSRRDVRITSFSGKSDLLGRHDVIHFNWPEWLVRWSNLWRSLTDLSSSLGLLWMARRRGAAVVWTGHDLEPHELPRPWLWRIFQGLFLSQTDLLISFGNGATKLLVDRYPRLGQIPVAVIPHGHYRDYYTGRPDVTGFRAQLALDERPVLLCFGQIRHYKNIPGIIRAWKQLPTPRPQLVIAGRPVNPELEAAIRSEAGDTPDVHLLLRFISDDEVPTIFGAADVLLMPYATRSALNSGVAHLALSLAKPAVLNDTVANRDVQEMFGRDWVHLCDGTPNDALRVGLEATAAPRAARPDLSAAEYAQLGSQMRQAYLDAMVSRRSGRRQSA